MDEAKVFTEKMSNNSLPWLIFNICDNIYAIHSKNVTSIITPPDRITPIPDASENYRGVIEVRGEIYPLLDMRKLFKKKSLEEECQSFIEMMDRRERDHLEWAEELERSVAEDKEFTLTSDPHACKFGIWYDEYKKSAVNADYVLHKIDKPHKQLHYTADLIASARAMPDSPEKTFRLKELVRMVAEEYVPEIRAIIDESKRKYRSFYRETFILLKTESYNLAIAVDKVLAVDSILQIEGKSSMNMIINSRYFIGVARNRRVDGDILMINDDKIIDIAQSEIPAESLK